MAPLCQLPQPRQSLGSGRAVTLPEFSLHFAILCTISLYLAHQKFLENRFQQN